MNAARGSDVLNFTHAGLYGRNRWNTPGQPTLYLAGDVGVAIAEWGRQFPVTYSNDAIRPAQREMFQLHLRLNSVVDVRSEKTLQSLPGDMVPDDFCDASLARSVATGLRQRASIQAMLVPSIAFLDDLTRWNLVVFLEKVPRDTAGWVTRVDRVGPLSWAPEPAAP